MNTQVTVIAEHHADEMFGYTFGVDGVMKMSAACEFLDVSRATIDRLAESNKIRIGKIGNGQVRICRRSINDYVRSLEK
jgi:excisionase family DNA binding protein